MTEAEKRKLNQQRQETSLKNTYFNRYLLLRYSIALFFFGNMYWLLIQLTTRTWLMLIPMILLILIVLACVEQFRLYGKTEANLDKTKRALHVQVVVQVLSLLVTLTPWFSFVFPVFADNALARFLLFILVSAGLGLLFINLKRIGQIEDKTDKAYLRYRQMEKSILR